MGDSLADPTALNHAAAVRIVADHAVAVHSAVAHAAVDLTAAVHAEVILADHIVEGSPAVHMVVVLAVDSQVDHTVVVLTEVARMAMAVIAKSEF